MNLLPKVTKSQANKLLAQGKRVGACSSKLSPWVCDGAFLCEITSIIDSTWTTAFKYYNCNAESGHDIHYYPMV